MQYNIEIQYKSGAYKLERMWKGDYLFQQAITWTWIGFYKIKKVYWRI